MISTLWLLPLPVFRATLRRAAWRRAQEGRYTPTARPLSTSPAAVAMRAHRRQP